MKHTILSQFFTFLLLLGATVASFAQKPSDDSEAVFAFVQVSPSLRGKNTAPGALPENHAKFQTAQRVFQQLVRSRGDLRQQVPQFVMSRRVKYVAWMDAEKVAIGLEEKAFDVCMNFGSDSLNALASLLAHEITHYYEKHDWTRHFAAHQHGSKLGNQLQSLDEGIKHEAQADYLGGFLAVSAGFQVLGLMPRLLDSLYKAYELPDIIEGYPSLEERKTMSSSAQQLLENLEYAHQMSIYLTWLGEFQEAEKYLRFILKDYQSREIFNNAGVLNILAALDSPAAVSKHPLPFLFPLEIDPVSRLNLRRGRAGDRSQLLQEAENHLAKAKLLDPLYTPAWLNISTVYALLEQWDDASYHVQKAAKLAQNDAENAAVHILKGIVAAATDEKQKARQHFLEAKRLGSALADFNLALLDGNNVENFLTPASANETGGAVEKIENFSLDKFALRPDVEKLLEVDGSKASLGIKTLEQSQIFVHQIERGKRNIFIQKTLPNYLGETQKNIRIGSKKTEVLENYATPTRILSTPDGETFIYFSQNIAFQFSKDGNLASWLVFKIK